MGVKIIVGSCSYESTGNPGEKTVRVLLNELIRASLAVDGANERATLTIKDDENES